MTTKYAIAVLFLLLALCALPAADAFAGDAQGPRIHIGEGRFDFGTVAAGSRPEHIFEIRNVGDAVLELLRVQPT